MRLWNSNNRSGNEQFLLSIFIRFGKTQPSMLPGWNHDKGLPLCSVNVAWLAAQLKCGNLWRRKVKGFSGEEEKGNINDYFKPLNDKPKAISVVPLKKLGPNRNESKIGNFKSLKDGSNNKKISMENKQTNSISLPDNLKPMKNINSTTNIPLFNKVTPESLGKEIASNGKNDEELKSNKRVSFARETTTTNNLTPIESKERSGNIPSKKQRSLSVFITNKDNKSDDGTTNKQRLGSKKDNAKAKTVTLNLYKQANKIGSNRGSKEKLTTAKKDRNKHPIKRSILKLKLPILVESVQEWNKSTNQAVIMIKVI